MVVILIGSSSSAVDISRDIAAVAKEVHIASRSVKKDGTLGKLPGYENMWLHSMIENVHEDGTVVFKDGGAVCADVILHCTGYKYYFPFLDTSGIVAVDDNCVGPLYKRIFPPFLAPGLSFVGLPLKPLFEFQSKWIAGVLSGRLVLPSPEEMLADVEAFYLILEASGVPKRYTHNIADYQFKYDDWLAAECGCPPVEEWRKEMYLEASKNKLIRPETFRDEWDDHHLVLRAHEHFGKHLSNGDLGEIIPQYLQ
ncbi:hypothetical protein F0562_012813 [Nyssa sinensis]|uniref:Flavin-containing monooxygenase n=1 Tax=Nyssa sinensis TaxID=561372 RepID=A0A5J4ZSW6_9ASTE|nr:hypothetical protein F0562_012813 [Nyssa sinensis]